MAVVQRQAPRALLTDFRRGMPPARGVDRHAAGARPQRRTARAERCVPQNPRRGTPCLLLIEKTDGHAVGVPSKGARSRGGTVMNYERRGVTIAASLAVIMFLPTMAMAGPARFVDNHDGTITDTRYGLQWEKKIRREGYEGDYSDLAHADNRYPWSGLCERNPAKLCQPTSESAALCAAEREGAAVGCDECAEAEGPCVVDSVLAGDVPKTAWAVAAARNAMNFAGHSDWRLPTRKELRKIRHRRRNPAGGSIFEAFDAVGCGPSCTDITSEACSCNQGGEYWSATTYPRDATMARATYFSYGGDPRVKRAASGYTCAWFAGRA